MSIDEDLKNAFSGESQANRKYLAWAKKAKKDGFPNIALMFKVIAEAETVHAHNHLRTLGMIKSTVENLKMSRNGEHYEIKQMYPEMLEHAKEGGNNSAKRTFHYALEAEKVHEKMYQEAIEAAKQGKDIAKKSYWVCEVCGYTGEGEPPDNCPICKAKKNMLKVID
ncbi:MAG: rubrerythrin family protein [Candidatus Lokiarchaeota archaeon]|nr:rubrerythrin family protein [Candidatus Lokiarchaeota archaeon]